MAGILSVRFAQNIDVGRIDEFHRGIVARLLRTARHIEVVGGSGGQNDHVIASVLYRAIYDEIGGHRGVDRHPFTNVGFVATADNVTCFNVTAVDGVVCERTIVIGDIEHR